MKTNPTEKKLPASPGGFLVVKLFVLLIGIPVLIPATGLFVQALAWRHVLCRIDGINFMGGLLEAFALSTALAGFCACANLFVTVAIDAFKKVKKIPLTKLTERKAPEIATWAEMYKALPGFRSVFQHFIVNALALACLSSFQPVRLHFDGAFQILLASGVLSATWIFCMIGMSVIVYAYMIQQLKTRAKAAAAKAVI